MALAFLFSRLFTMHRNITIADNPLDKPFAVIIDHKLRENSSEEVKEVSKELRRMGLRTAIRAMKWKTERSRHFDPTTLPNLESLARSYRYQLIGSSCYYLQATSLFVAHHRDDQYETVLMRLLGGHGYRGLQGMHEANAIPECYHMHGVYNSGMLDDQLKTHPYLSFRPPNKEMKQLQRFLKTDQRLFPSEYIGTSTGSYGPSEPFPGYISRERDPSVPYLRPLHSEDGGINVYRPLLEFDKDRLVATCEANGVKWFEDYTNKDPTLTTRNAIRHLTKNYTLPAALQKSSILALRNRAKKRIALEESEARRILIREGVVKDFDPNVGSLHVDLPPLTFGRARHRLSRAEASKSRRRLYAALIIRKLIEFVTPDIHLPAPSNLENIIRRLYPHLYGEPTPSEPKSFSIAGVLFEPIPSPGNTRWFLTRAPYASNKAIPERRLPGSLGQHLPSMDQPPPRSRIWRSWKVFKSWDNRFWIKLSTCVDGRFSVAPFSPQHAKQFRRALPPRSRTRLEQILKYHAPGKSRYSLPGIYSIEESPDASAQSGKQEFVYTLLALPSLGIHIPGLERWVKYDIRYKKVDIGLLAKKSKHLTTKFLGNRQRCSASRRRRKMHMNKM